MNPLVPSVPPDGQQERGLIRPKPELATETSGLIPYCPRCSCKLKGVKHETGIAWRCASCGGESLNFSQFRRLIPELHANEIWMTAMEQPVAPRRRARCPECRRDMAAVLIPFQGREVELDICRGCQRLWMENQEDQANKLDLRDPEPGRKPPVIRMTGRGAERMLGEQLKRIRSGLEPGEHPATKWVVGTLLLIYVLARIWLHRR